MTRMPLWLALLILHLSLFGFATGLLFVGWSIGLAFSLPGLLAYLAPAAHTLIGGALLLIVVLGLFQGKESVLRSVGLGTWDDTDKATPMISLMARLNTLTMFVMITITLSASLTAIPLPMALVFLATTPFTWTKMVIAAPPKPA